MSDRRRSGPRTARTALRSALVAAYDEGTLNPVADGAAAAVAVDLAGALDTLPADAGAFDRARLARVLLEALRELRLTPASRVPTTDHLAALLRDLAVPD